MHRYKLLHPDKPLPHITPHVFRHTFCTNMATAGMKAGTAIRVLCVIPFVSVYIAPSRFLMGDIGFGWLALGWLLQALVALLLVKLCAAVYGALMIHKGERVKPKQILAMMKGGAKA